MDKPLDKMTLEELLDLMIDTPHKTMRSMVRNEILRREKKFRKSVEGALKEVEEDERLGYPTATVDVNAPLALIQCALPAPSEGFEICIDGAGCEGRGRMNLKDRFAEFVLAAFDRFMDFITLGTWTRVQGEVMWKKMKVKE